MKYNMKALEHTARQTVVCFLKILTNIADNLKFLYFFSINSKLRQPTRVLYAYTVLTREGKVEQSKTSNEH